MKIIIKDKKKELFISIFHVLKNASTDIHANFSSTCLHIQGMDKSHICLFDLTLSKEWFDFYEIENEDNIHFNTNIFYSIISSKSDDQSLIIKKDDDDSLSIELINEFKKSEYNKYFKMPLLEYEYEEMSIPNIEYDCEMTLPSKKINDMLAQLNNFSDNITVKCCENFVDFITKGNSGEMRVNIPIDDMISYAIVENEEVNLTYSLIYIHKMCISNKLSSDVDLCLSNECPMKINYNLGNDSHLMFFIAPKLEDD
jgi:proliferating cell nuclear antigen